MNLKVVIEDNIYAIQVSGDVIENGESFYKKMDSDMSKGWQMNRDWVASPNQEQRCQIAADRIADALATENETLVHLMVGYILTKLPDTKEVHIHTGGEMAETQFITV